MEVIRNIIAIIAGFSGGVVIAGGVFAFIAVIGVVPRLAQKTGTELHAKTYEEAIIFGGIGGTIASISHIIIPFGNILSIILSFCGGVFLGCVAMSIAEVLDVIPIMTRRIKIQHSMFFFVMAIALGKLIGSLLYFIVPGFYRPN